MKKRNVFIVGWCGMSIRKKNRIPLRLKYYGMMFSLSLVIGSIPIFLFYFDWGMLQFILGILLSICTYILYVFKV